MNKLNQAIIDKCAAKTTSYDCLRDLVASGKACAENKISVLKKATLDLCQDICESTKLCAMISISPGEGMKADCQMYSKVACSFTSGTQDFYAIDKGTNWITHMGKK